MDNQDNKNTKVKRTKEEIRLYNRLYYAYVRKNDKYYQHYAKEYHANNKDFYKYKYQLKTMESMNKKRDIKVSKQRVKISDNNLILEI